jgi:S1-C subfamily serine protease
MLHRRRYLESPQSRRTRWSIAVVAVCALASAPPLWAQPAGDLRQFSVALESLSEQVRPAVVQIFATGFTPGEGVVPSAAALLSRQQGSGSGVILGADGYVITNAHVIENASRIRVELALVETDADGPRSVLRPRGEVVGAQVVGIDQLTLGELLAAWTAHDLNHIVQISQVMARRYRDDVGVWRQYLGVMRTSV